MTKCFIIESGFSLRTKLNQLRESNKVCHFCLCLIQISVIFICIFLLPVKSYHQVQFFHLLQQLHCKTNKNTLEIWPKKMLLTSKWRIKFDFNLHLKMNTHNGKITWSKRTFDTLRLRPQDSSVTFSAKIRKKVKVLFWIMTLQTL